MQALVQEGSGSADVLRLREVEMPALANDRVLVRVHAASVNAADWHTVHGGAMVGLIGTLLRQPPAPPIRGGDLAGVVEAVGADVTGFKVGDEVFGTGRGSFAEYATASPRSIAPKPRNASFVDAAAIAIAGCTALQGLRDIGHARPGQRVLVYGAGGGVGTFAVQIGKALGANVTAVTSGRNLEIVRSLGADEVIDGGQEDVTRRRDRYDVIFDVAATRPLGSLRRILDPNGTLVLAGAAKGGGLAIVGRLLKARLLSRFGSRRMRFFLAHITHDDLVTLGELVEAGALRPAIDRTYALTDGAEAVRYLGTGTARAKVVITME